MTTERADLSLERLLTAIERELLAASDEEVLAAARELGIKPDMKSSAALVGVTMFARPRALSPLAERSAGPAPAGRDDGPTAPRPRRRPKGDSASS